ncbi:MAG: NUDIX domain-containing protein [Acidimicrobiales bacterium]|jgi:8-oxo-dGTP pyrophosphatase MutT (NUDIX family)
MEKAAPEFNDVVCGLLVRSGRSLFVHRNSSRTWAPDRWDAPGGHIERGESDFDALAREMFEELGVVVAPDGARLVARLTGAHYDARVFVIDAWSGEPENRAPEEHDDLAWFDAVQASRLVLADPELVDIVVDVLRHAAGMDG